MRIGNLVKASSVLLLCSSIALGVSAYPATAVQAQPAPFLPAPNLSSPDNSATDVASPVFSWSAVSGATSYRIMVGTSPFGLPTDPTADTGSGLVINATTSGTTYVPEPGVLSEGATYWWEVTARSATQYGTWSSKWSFTTKVSPLLPAPGLISPGDGATGLSTTPTLTWSAVTGATSYRIMVSTSPIGLPSDARATGGTGLAVNATTSGTSFTPAPGMLSGGITYYWQVSANNPNQFGVWSGRRGFTTLSTPTPFPAPVLSSPADGATGLSITPTFTWSAVTGATSYRIMIGTSAGGLPSDPAAESGSGVLVNSTLPGTSYTVDPGILDEGVTYWWQVRARAPTPSGAWSGKRAFTTKTSATLPAPVLVSPADAAAVLSTTPTFSWSAVSGATSYRIMVGTSPFGLPDDVRSDPGAGVVINAVASVTSYTPDSGVLKAGETYYWEVRGQGPGQPGAWSGKRRFTTQAVPLVTPPAPPAAEGSRGFPSVQAAAGLLGAVIVALIVWYLSRKSRRQRVP